MGTNKFKAVNEVLTSYFENLKATGALNKFATDRVSYAWLTNQVLEAGRNAELDEESEYYDGITIDDRRIIRMQDIQDSQAAFSESFEDRKGRQ